MKYLYAIFKIAIVSLFLYNPAVWAHSPNDKTDSNIATLKPLTAEASLIFFGKVAKIQYRNSEPTKEQPYGLPHTFVTYKVDKVLRGKAPKRSITLRIPGGADGQGGIYTDTSAPMFSRGQSDVLFVKGREIDECQLVGCVEGRFRVHQDQVFNAWGVPVVEADKSLRLGGIPRFDLNVMDVPRPDFDRLLQNPAARIHLKKQMQSKLLSMDEMRELYNKEAPEFTTIKFGFETEPVRKDKIKEPEAEPVEKFGKPMKAEDFFEAIRKWSEVVGEPKYQVVIANPRNRFTIPDPKLDALAVEKVHTFKVESEEREDDKTSEQVQRKEKESKYERD